MKNLIGVIIVTFLFLNGCKGVSGSHGSAHKNASADNNGPEESKARIVSLYPNMAEETKLQKAVDSGWQAWRLNPVDVAHANMINQGVNVRIEDCSLMMKKDDQHAVVRVLSKDGKDMNVYVERLVRPDGIWTATQVEINKEGEPQVMELDASHVHDHEHHHH